MSEALEPRRLLAVTIVGGGTFSTIQAAVTAASPGQTIVADAGTYNETVTINKSLTIKGAQAGVDARSNLRQSGAGESVLAVPVSAGFGFNITASDVTIDGFTVQGQTGIGLSEVGVLIAPNMSGTHLVNNIVQNNVTGMYLANASASDGAVIQHNVFALNNQPGNNGGRAIYTDGGVAGAALQNVSIDGNYFYQNLGSTGTTGLEAAIAFEAQAIVPSNISVANNTFENNGKAVLAINMSNLTITGNTITDSQDSDSGALRFEGGVSGVTIQNNNIYYNLSPAIRMDSKGIASPNGNFTITGNNIYGNGYVDIANPPPGNVPGSVVIAPGTYSGPGSLPMTNNWWGDASGPSGDGSGTGDILKAQGNAVTFTPFATTPFARQSPFTGLAVVPDTNFQAVGFDHGGSGVGFLVGSGTVNSGMNFRETAVSTQTTTDPGGLYNQPYIVNGLLAGQWLAYTVSVPTNGTYKIDMRVANSQATGGTVHFTLDGASVGGSVVIPTTGGPQIWQTTSTPNFNVTAGQHVIKLLCDTNGTGGTIGNFHWFKLTTVNAPPAAPSNLVAVPSSSQILLTWTNNAVNQTGFQIDRSTDGTTFTNAYATVGASTTSYSDTAVTVGGTYYYRVEATNALGSSSSSNVATAVATASSPVTYVSDLTWVSATAGFGTVQKDTSINGNPIKLRGTTYPKGLGTHAASTIVYALNGQYTNFVSDVGVDDEEIGKGGTVTFQVLGDNNAVLFPQTAVLTPASAVVHINVSVVGVQQLTLVVGDGGDGIDFDHADWAGAKLLQLPAAPSGLTATAVTGGINLSWTNNANNQTGFEIDRSTDGTTFTMLANVAANATAYSDTSTLTPGATYYYRVDATNAAGLSAPSNTANAVAQKLAPLFTGLTASPTITYGQATTTLSGTVKNGTIIPTGNVVVTVNGVPANAAINQTTGAFSVNYDTHALPASGTAYTITYSYAGDTKFGTGSDTSTTITVNKRTLHVTATGTAKVYDGLRSATVTFTDDRVNSDVFTDSATSLLYADKNVGTGKTITISGIGITGAGAGNYTLAATTTTATANITARTLHVTPTGVNKVYDGLLSDTITETDDRVTGDVVTLGYTANFADKNVGTNKTVSITGMNLTGTDAADYALPGTTGSTTANITARTLTVSAIGTNRVYDGTTSAAVTLSDNRIAGDVLTTNFTSAAFADKNVGTGKTITVGGITMGGAGAGNYTLGNTTANTTANITPKALTVTATGVNKVYDRTTSATVTLSDNRIAGDLFTDSSTSATFADKQVANGKTIAVTGIAITGADAANYTFNGTASATANITPANLTVNVTGVDKVYNGNTTATVTTTDNRIAGDVFTVNYTASFADKNVGTTKPVTVTGINLSGADAVDYTLTGTTGSTTANITARTLTFTATGVNKVYDQTNSATVTLGDNRIAGDVFTDNYFVATFPDKNAGDNRTITVSGLTIIGADSGNYVFGSTATGTANITPKPLAVTATATGKVYDGNTTAAVTLSDNRLGGDVFTDNYTGAAFNNKIVGVGKTVTISGISLSGTDAGNYAPNTSTSATADVTQRGLTVTATGVNRVYDGTTSATVTLGDNRVAGDVFTDSYTSASFADKLFGAAKPVSVGGISVSGTDAANYSAPNTTANTTANITQRALTVTATGVNKVYDATTSATVTLSDNRVAGDVLSTSYTGATYANKNVGNGKTIAVTGIAVTGTDVGNYTFNNTASATANVTPKTLNVTAAGVNRIYDGTASATVTLADDRIAGDVVTDSYAAATFADKNVGTAKAVSVSGIALAGTDAGNYAQNTLTATTANITPRSLTVTATGVNRVYDGTTSATVTLSDNRVAGDVFADSYTGATFVNKTVGTGKTIGVSGIGISGTDAANYSAPNATASTTANVTQRALTVTATGVSKLYDATTSATVTLSDNRVAGDVLTDTYTGATFVNKNVGAAKTVGVTGVNVTGTDVANYTFNNTASATADITPKALTVTATGVDKTYDGNTSATATLSDNRIAGDVFTDGYASAAFVDKNVGAGKTVNVSGIAITGTDAANYAANTLAVATATINPRILTISATGTNKAYDGTTSATVTLNDNRVGGDVFTDSYGSATFVNKNAGNSKTISVTGITVLGTDAGNYVINTTTSTTANITPLSITGSITASNKAYDATTAAGIATRNLAGVLGADVVALIGGSATFDTKNVGTGKTVTATGLALSGADAGNYVLSNTTETATANVTAIAITGSFTASNKVYDGITSATIGTRSLTGVLGLDVVSLSGGAATFDTKNVGVGKTVTATGLALSGADAGNYTLGNPTETATANVTALGLTGWFTASSKQYDGTTAATISTRNLTGAIGGDVVSLSGGTATFDSKNVGNGKNVTATGLTLSGADAGNYSLGNATETTTANVTAAFVSASITAASKPYDGTTAASLQTQNLLGVLGSDVVSLTGGTATFADKNVGTGKTVSVTGLGLTGADAGNYILSNPNPTTTGNITPELVLNGTVGSDDLRLKLDTNGQLLDWFVFNGANPVQVGQLALADASGLTINGNGGTDTVLLDYGNGSPVPSLLHLNGTFVINGLNASNPQALGFSTIEMGNSTVYFGYSGTSPVTILRQALVQGYNNGTWAGGPTAAYGAIVSTNASSGPAGVYGIGYADSADGLIAGQPANTVELRFTVMGDANLDRVVNSTDAIQMTRNYNATGSAAWDLGNFNYDASVNMLDALILQKNFNAVATGAAVAAVTPATSTPSASDTSSGSTSSGSSGSTSSSSSTGGSAGLVAVTTTADSTTATTSTGTSTTTSGSSTTPTTPTTTAGAATLTMAPPTSSTTTSGSTTPVTSRVTTAPAVPTSTTTPTTTTSTTVEAPVPVSPAPIPATSGSSTAAGSSASGSSAPASFAPVVITPPATTTVTVTQPLVGLVAAPVSASVDPTPVVTATGPMLPTTVENRPKSVHVPTVAPSNGLALQPSKPVDATIHQGNWRKHHGGKKTKK